jgi:GDPmannose 4,6-dehydratase
MTTALITGISGQTGSYLADLLVDKGYDVHGIVRRESTINTTRIDHLLYPKQKITLHYGDLDDNNSLVSILMKVRPDEIYNIGSQSHVRVSFDIPVYTADVTGIGPLRILEAMRSLGLNPEHTADKVRFLQASSSEMFGLIPPPQNENTPFMPVSPYGCAKLFAYHITQTYRWGYKMFAANSICFNHESPRRAETFVTKKIVRGAVRIKLGLQEKIYLGNLTAKRDWGHAKDYAQAQYMIMHAALPDDYVVATEEYHSVKAFAERVFNRLNLDMDSCVEIKDYYFRPNEVPALRGDATKIREQLGWRPTVSFDELINEMIDSVMEEEKKKKYSLMQDAEKEALKP